VVISICHSHDSGYIQSYSYLRCDVMKFRGGSYVDVLRRFLLKKKKKKKKINKYFCAYY
jgi:hypothetical protein